MMGMSLVARLFVHHGPRKLLYCNTRPKQTPEYTTRPTWKRKESMNARRAPWTLTVLLTALLTGSVGFCEEPVVFDAGQLRPISPALRGQNPSRNLPLKALDSLFALCRGSMARGLAGGLDADTYDWRDRDGGSGWGARGAMPTTLEFLVLCRRYRCEPLLTVNLFGGGSRGEDGTWSCETADPGRLAADWVRYCNRILPEARRGGEANLSEEDRRVLESITGWDDRPTLPPPGAEATPRVQYWEIGNEPELGGIAGLVTNHPLSAEQYARRYAEIARAMRRVDPSIRVGPCLIYPARGGKEYLQALRKEAVAIDFVSYHPYYHDLQNAWGDGQKLTVALVRFKSFLTRETAGAWQVVGRRTPLIASEWNPMMWNASGKQQRSMAMALGVLEGMFTFAELGVGGAMFWEQAQSKPAVRAVYEELAGNLGTHVMFGPGGRSLYRPGEPGRVYGTVDLGKNKVVLWLLNFRSDKPMERFLGVQRVPFPVRSASLRVLTGGQDDAGLMAHKTVRWEDRRVELSTTNGLPTVRLRIPPASIGVAVLSGKKPAPTTQPASRPVPGPTEAD